jgi:hypothetical protein
MDIYHLSEKGKTKTGRSCDESVFCLFPGISLTFKFAREAVRVVEVVLR